WGQRGDRVGPGAGTARGPHGDNVGPGAGTAWGPCGAGSRDSAGTTWGQCGAGSRDHVGTVWGREQGQRGDHVGTAVSPAVPTQPHLHKSHVGSHDVPFVLSSKGDAWAKYMAEVQKYKAHQCSDDDKTRPLVK
uniref:Uncharacterized protein n=1 Tax=Nothoprocta perdicaria TaxID=30464 RepID=A0A8C7EHR6_NOTPE